MLTRIPRDHQYKIPPAFRNLQRFIFCKLVVNERTGKTDKLPCDYYGNVCSAHDPAKWLTLAQLNSSPISEDLRFTVAIVIVEGDGIWCLDLDGCFVSPGKLTPAAQTIVNMFPGAYVETSISGNGLHILGRGSVGPHRTRAAGLELYTRARFIALTGLDARGDAGLDYSAHLEHFVDAYGLRLTADEVQAAAVPGDGPRPGSTGQFLTDDELIAALCSAESRAGAFGDRARPRDLWHGNADVLAAVWPASGRFDGCTFDRSSADAALMMHLSYYTGGHIARMVALFRRSALYRPELNESDLWRKNAKSINKAIAGGKFYDKPPRAQQGTQVQPMPTVTPGGMVLPPVPGTPQVPGMPAVPGVLPLLIAWEDFRPRAELYLPKRDFLYGKHYIRRETSATVAPPGTGKTALVFVEMLAMITARRLLRDLPERPLRVIYFGEDDRVEIERRFLATVKYYKIPFDEYFGKVAIYSMRDFPIRLAMRNNGTFSVNANDINAIKNLIRTGQGDLVIFDTMTKIHNANENDNGDMDALINELNKIASECNCAVELLLHTRKSSFGIQIDSIDQTRGASAIIGAVRSARLIMRMSDSEAEEQNVSESDRWQFIRFGDAKTNQAPPPDKSQWLQLTNITLENGDNVQTIKTFARQEEKPVDYLPNQNQIIAIVNAIEMGYRRFDDGTKYWAGRAVAEAMGISIDKALARRLRGKNMATVKNILKSLVENKFLEVVWSWENRNRTEIYRRIVRDDNFKPMDV